MDFLLLITFMHEIIFGWDSRSRWTWSSESTSALPGCWYVYGHTGRSQKINFPSMLPTILEENKSASFRFQEIYDYILLLKDESLSDAFLLFLFYGVFHFKATFMVFIIVIFSFLLTIFLITATAYATKRAGNNILQENAISTYKKGIKCTSC